METSLPKKFSAWFKKQRWQPRPYQLQMLEAFKQQHSTLLIAPTGGGKTLSGFLPSLIAIDAYPRDGLHTLYISPLKSLTHDIERNLMRPIEEMGLAIRLESRTGDTPAYKRQRQRKKPPHILLTTPESLMLMLSYADASQIFGKLKLVIIDETHTFAHNKRGDFTSLALARLEYLVPGFIRFGLSATVADPQKLAAWLMPTGKTAQVIKVQSEVKPRVTIIDSKEIPYGGFMAKYAVDAMYQHIKAARTTIIFVNTRAQAELMFRFLWEVNKEALPIAIYHGSLSKEQRAKVENLMASGGLRAIVSTSALELGIDWGNVDKVMQVGAPKGVSRLLQRIGRSNHRMDEPSEAILVPANRFEVVECLAAMQAIHKGKLDGEPMLTGSMDVIVQYIINCVCSEPSLPETLYQQVITANPYHALTPDDFNALLQFAVDGGYVLKNYERFSRLIQDETGKFKIASPMVAARHRQNIGTIVEGTSLRVLRAYKKHKGTYLGQVEESFAQRLAPGDTFFFAGQVLEFVGIYDMVLEAKPSKMGDPKVPTYAGGQMPLSTFLAEGVKALMGSPESWKDLPAEVQEWLELQRRFSQLPQAETLLVEHFLRQKRYYSMIYTFDGRKANQTLGMLITRRMERMKLKPLSFSATDYAVSIVSLRPMSKAQCEEILDPDILGDELEEWIVDSPMLKRSFRNVAMITGLTQQRHAGAHKNVKQVTFSTDLIYDVLRKYEPHHILLQVTRNDAERELLDIRRLSEMLNRYKGKMEFRLLKRASPMAIPILVDIRRERIMGEGIEELLLEQDDFTVAEKMMDEVRNDIA